ncbi:MAG: peptide chain release factor N(5)-glutamine methyltransferase, partial [bacterium]
MATVRDMWVFGAEYLQRQGIETSKLDAEVLLRYITGKSREEFYRDLAEAFPENISSRWEEILNRRAQGTPVAYITGEKEFFGLSFQVSPAVLVPRPETEILVARVLELFRQGVFPSGSWVLDVGTGSGAIAVSLAVSLPQAQIIATDISTKALAVATANAKRHGVEPRVRFEVADLWPSSEHLSRLLVGQPGFGLVVSNPPYIESEEITRLAPEVRQEPVLALDGGPDGLAVYRRLIDGLKEHLLPGAW